MSKKVSVPRQRPIPVTFEERTQLDKMKASYEEITGQRCDWGKFLIDICLLGLESLKDGYSIVTTVRVKHSTENINEGGESQNA